MSKQNNQTVSPNWLSSLIAGAILGLLLSIFAISLASLIFTGPLAAELPRGIAMVLVTVTINAAGLAFFSGGKGVIATIPPTPLVVMAASAGAVAASLAAPEAILPTVLILIALTTLLTGGALILLGRFKLGVLVRYLPYPVIGGYMTGVGALLLLGGIGTMAGFSPSLANLARLFTLQQLGLWLPGLLFGLVIFIGMRRIRHGMTLPGLLLVGLVLFYLVLWLSGNSVSVAIAAGFLLGDLGQAGGWPLLPLAHLGTVEWGAIGGQLGNISVVFMFSAITLLLVVSSIELATREDMDLNRELRAVGLANILSGLAGGLIGNHSLLPTALGRQMAGRSPYLGYIVGVVPLLVLFFGLPLLAFVPKALLGSLLAFQGIAFLFEWVVEKRRSLPPVDYGVVLIVGLVIVAADFLTGIVLGLVIMVIMFVIDYSRTDIFRHKLSGAEVASHVERNAHHRRELIKLGQHIHILELHGFIFFGTANAILTELQARLHDETVRPLLFLILDFRRVTGLDSSAALSFMKARSQAEAQGFTILFTHLSPRLEQQLAHNGIQSGEHFNFFPDLDRALEWCEDELIEREQVTQKHLPTTLPLQLADSGFSKEHTRQVKRYLEKLRLAPQDVLMRQGEPADAFYFIELGQVSIYLEMDGQQPVRLQTLGIGTLVGEVAFFLGTPRTATVIADTTSIVYRLTRAAMESMQAEEPSLALAFKDLMLRFASERLVAANREISALNR